MPRPLHNGLHNGLHNSGSDRLHNRAPRLCNPPPAANRGAPRVARSESGYESLESLRLRGRGRSYSSIREINVRRDTPSALAAWV